MGIEIIVTPHNYLLSLSVYWALAKKSIEILLQDKVRHIRSQAGISQEIPAFFSRLCREAIFLTGAELAQRV